MEIKIVPSDRRMSVDGDARTIDCTGVPAALHALRFETVVSCGRAWYTDERGDSHQEELRDFAPYQFLLDRWTAAAPPPPPPPPPPVDQSDIDNLEKGLKALALCIAQVGGLTVPQMKALFKVKWDALP